MRPVKHHTILEHDETDVPAGTTIRSQRCGEVCFNAFTAISRRHDFPPDFPSAEVTTGLMNWLLTLPHVYSVVAEVDGEIAAASEFGGSGFLLPMRNSEVFRWCLAEGLRVTQPLTLMSLGLYNEPRGAFQSSILF